MPKSFWDGYSMPERPEGKYVSMRDMSKLGEPIHVSAVIDDDRNMWQGENKPRFLLRGKVGDGAEDVLVSVSKGYSRDDVIADISTFLDENEGATVSVRFQKSSTSAYIEMLPA